MIQKKVRSEEFAGLRRAAARIPKFASYFRGIKPVNLTVPSNILLFCRFTKSKLADSESERFHHNRFVLVVNLQTNGCINVDGVVVPLSPGEAFLIFPFQFHSFLNLQTPEICWLIITFELEQQDAVTPLRNIVLPASEIFLQTIHSMLEMTAGKSFTFEKPDNRFVLHAGLLVEDLINIRKALHRPRNSPKAEKSEDVLFLERVNRVIWQKINEPKSILQLAVNVGYSESHLRSLFRKKFGMSLGSYLKRIYILRAASLIQHSELNVSEIAEECGFSSVYSFSRTFKSQMGMSPLAYRHSVLTI